MTQQINQLTRATAMALSDLLVIWSGADQDTRAATGTQLLALMQANLTFPGLNLAQQYAAPSATAFNVVIAQADSWLVLTPTAGFAAGTITLPAVRTNEQIVRVNCTQAVTALTVAGAGTTVTGAPTTLAANGFFTMAYDGVLNAWYRVG